MPKIFHGTQLYLFWSTKVSYFCIQLSTCILFVWFRYGYRPIPSEIDTAELELLREALVSMGNDVHLLDKWYRKDTNKVTE